MGVEISGWVRWGEGERLGIGNSGGGRSQAEPLYGCAWQRERRGASTFSSPIPAPRPDPARILTPPAQRPLLWSQRSLSTRNQPSRSGGQSRLSPRPGGLDPSDSALPAGGGEKGRGLASSRWTPSQPPPFSCSRWSETQLFLQGLHVERYPGLA